MSKQEEFILLHKEWMTWFDSEDNNCILKQVQFMLFDTLIYRIVLKAREITTQDEKGVRKVNGAIHWLLDKCFFSNQLMIIRRLTDPNSEARSIKKLLNVMHSRRMLLTRENFFLVNSDYEYDYSSTKKKYDEYVREQEKDLKVGQPVSYVIPTELDWEKSENMHRDFDTLSGVDYADRKPSNTISSSVFQMLFQKLDECQPLRKHVDHFIAHTLRAEKREKLHESAVRVTYEQLWKAQEIISYVTKFIGLFLLNRVDYGLLPLSHYSLLKYIELPLVQNEKKAELRGVEDEFRKEIHEWSKELANLKINSPSGRK